MTLLCRFYTQENVLDNFYQPYLGQGKEMALKLKVNESLNNRISYNEESTRGGSGGFLPGPKTHREGGQIILDPRHTERVVTQSFVGLVNALLSTEGDRKQSYLLRNAEPGPTQPSSTKTKNDAAEENLTGPDLNAHSKHTSQWSSMKFMLKEHSLSMDGHFHGVAASGGESEAHT